MKAQKENDIQQCKWKIVAAGTLPFRPPHPSPLEAGSVIAAMGSRERLSSPSQARLPNAFWCIFRLSGRSFQQAFSCYLSLENFCIFEGETLQETAMTVSTQPGVYGIIYWSVCVCVFANQQSRYPERSRKFLFSRLDSILVVR